MRAIQFKSFGGPEVLELVNLSRPKVKDHQVLIKTKAIGVNYADTMRREGNYVLPTPLPFIPGSEVVGEVNDVGKAVTTVAKGDTVVALVGAGAYADFVVADEASLIRKPDTLDAYHAVALPLQALSAYHIITTMGRLQEGESILIHAAGGGVGSLAVQLAKLFGAEKVLATASTESKRQLAKQLGADEVIDYTQDKWDQHILDITDGRGVDVVLEMAGGDIFQRSVQCLAPFGRLIIYGVASGETPVLNPVDLMEKNKTVTGFFLPAMMEKPALYQKSLQKILGLAAEGKLKTIIGKTYSIEDASQLHADMQNRKTQGKLILIP
ncbi:NADPH:quinone oxidoreductase family protein [Salipaludibacillus agaradhaerens]|uniref:NADPH:quinone oxidoreductase family protein n=1 Tax=Salipaludibacillus agaradhaerens TaxID=76935 RepID=A0A9Q4B094_SALAG|nr:NADPH:quinone oxidoreductase family protein [Salipaludibacillus agaradhaerens]MCR6096007.1 NADPH:quinone oxidoreductase family protein [Salipaludibacillus agaradhaerens]MCR6114434.1 NADPH:quinone oxidoreductase family protein [Salipaludibacillus agaradhaerens]